MKVTSKALSRTRDVFRHCGRLELVAKNEREAKVLARLLTAISVERTPIEQIVERLEQAASKGAIS